jgi:murein peptide amidase A
MRKSYLSPALLAALLCVLFAVVPAAAFAADSVPPVTTCDAPSGWQGAPFTVHFTASDDDSGVAATWAAIDGGQMREVGGPAGASIDVPAPADHSFDGVHTLSYYSVDVAGNSEDAQTVEVKVDTTGPSTSVRAAVGYVGRAVALKYLVDDRLSPDVTAVTLVVTDGVGQTVASFALGGRHAGVWYRIRWKPPATGVFHFSVAAQDLAGNAQVSAGSARIVVKWLAHLTIGRSCQRRPIRVIQFGSGGRRLLVVGGVHGNESGTAVARQFVTYLLAHAKALPSGARIDVITCANPDGYAHRTRGNARHVDLNRNLPTRDWRRRLSALNEPGAPSLTGGVSPGSEPETKALLTYLRTGFSVVISLHSRAGILDCSGPGSRALGRRMSALCHFPVSKLWYDPYITGSLGRFVPERYHVPIVTVELLRPKLGSGMRAALLAAAR